MIAVIFPSWAILCIILCLLRNLALNGTSFRGRLFPDRDSEKREIGKERRNSEGRREEDGGGGRESRELLSYCTQQLRNMNQ